MMMMMMEEGTDPIRFDFVHFSVANRKRIVFLLFCFPPLSGRSSGPAPPPSFRFHFFSGPRVLLLFFFNWISITFAAAAVACVAIRFRSKSDEKPKINRIDNHLVCAGVWQKKKNGDAEEMRVEVDRRFSLPFCLSFSFVFFLIIFFSLSDTMANGGRHCESIALDHRRIKRANKKRNNATTITATATTTTARETFDWTSFHVIGFRRKENERVSTQKKKGKILERYSKDIRNILGGAESAEERKPFLGKQNKR